MPEKTIIEHISSNVAPAEAVMFLAYLGFCILAVAAFVHWMVPENCRNKWWYFATGIVTLLAIILLFLLDIERLDQLGGFLAGVFSPLAILWFVAAYRQQSEELSMQREELKLQREAIEQQTKEWNDLKLFSAMEKAQQIIKPYDDEHYARTKYKLLDLPVILVNSIIACHNCKPGPSVCGESDPYESLFSTIEDCNHFFSRYLAAVALYQRFSGIPLIMEGLSSYENVLNQTPDTIPTITRYTKIATSVASIFKINAQRISSYANSHMNRQDKTLAKIQLKQLTVLVKELSRLHEPSE